MRGIHLSVEMTGAQPSRLLLFGERQARTLALQSQAIALLFPNWGTAVLMVTMTSSPQVSYYPDLFQLISNASFELFLLIKNQNVGGHKPWMYSRHAPAF
jgi:hypothetical protein